ncbi:hypothetical protein [Rappaport israeli]|uniref:hypothetical protein n=1 Tax=Rappaport israeli TaxID=1839807 RepID=UPI0013018664|nr:hypothetical protein [Rappaport israeli]
MSYYGERIAIDLSTLSLQEKQVPHLHNRDRHVGFGWLSLEDNKLIVHSDMLDHPPKTSFKCRMTGWNGNSAST